MSEFDSLIKKETSSPLRADRIDTLQINMGRYCNQACRHCHVDAGPDRSEAMSLETINSVLGVLKENDIGSVDVTGGAPELHPHIEFLVRELGRLDKRIIFRSNLTSLLLPGKGELLGLLRDNKVAVVASLPCYLEKNVDRQRGEGVFALSIKALRLLNSEGYGKEGGDLTLDLVHNPVGPSLPGDQASLESDYRRELKSGYGVVFNKLLVIANMPIGRFREELLKTDNYTNYSVLLRKSFNRETVPCLMCRGMLSVGWDGRVFDCDFNQTLGITVNGGAPSELSDFDYQLLVNRVIQVRDHCFGCTAGRGSSCGGELWHLSRG